MLLKVVFRILHPSTPPHNPCVFVFSFLQQQAAAATSSAFGEVHGLEQMLTQLTEKEPTIKPQGQKRKLTSKGKTKNKLPKVEAHPSAGAVDPRKVLPKANPQVAAAPAAPASKTGASAKNETAAHLAPCTKEFKAARNAAHSNGYKQAQRAALAAGKSEKVAKDEARQAGAKAAELWEQENSLL